MKGTRGTKPNYGFVINSKHEVAHLMCGGFIYQVTDVFEPSPHIYILSQFHLAITPRFMADIRIRKDADHEIIVHEPE